MERHKIQRNLGESPTTSELESFKKGWKKAFRIGGLLTLGAIAYITNELITGNFTLNEVSDGLVTLFGFYSAITTLKAYESLSYASSLTPQRPS